MQDKRKLPIWVNDSYDKVVLVDDIPKKYLLGLLVYVGDESTNYNSYVLYDEYIKNKEGNENE